MNPTIQLRLRLIWAILRNRFSKISYLGETYRFEVTGEPVVSWITARERLNEAKREQRHEIATAIRACFYERPGTELLSDDVVIADPDEILNKIWDALEKIDPLEVAHDG